MTMVPSERQMVESVQSELAYWREKAERLERESVTSHTGYRLVPVEPTEDMLVAFYEVYLSKKRAHEDDDGKDWWAAMLRAALSPNLGADDEASAEALTKSAQELAKMLRADHAEPWMTIGGKPFALDSANTIDALLAHSAALRAEAKEGR